MMLLLRLLLLRLLLVPPGVNGALGEAPCAAETAAAGAEVAAVTAVVAAAAADWLLAAGLGAAPEGTPAGGVDNGCSAAAVRRSVVYMATGA